MAERIYLVYAHKTNDMKLVSNGVGVMDEMELTIAMSKYPDIRMVTKAIKPGSTSIDIFKSDLETADSVEKGENGGEVKEEIPWRTFLGHEFIGHTFEELTILYPFWILDGKPKET